MFAEIIQPYYHQNDNHRYSAKGFLEKKNKKKCLNQVFSQKRALESKY